MSASGKSTISSLIAVRMDLKSVDLDNIFWDLKNTRPGGQVLRDKNEVDEKLTCLLKKDHWVVNGIYLEDRILNDADKIVFLKQNVVRALLWQWKRYFQDTVQREIYGFRNNLNLSKIILRQHLNSAPDFVFDSYRYVTVKKMENYLKENYGSKLIVTEPKNYKYLMRLLV